MNLEIQAERERTCKALAINKKTLSLALHGNYNTWDSARRGCGLKTAYELLDKYDRELSELIKEVNNEHMGL